MRMLLTVMAGVIALAGCATPAEQAAVMSREMDRMIVVYGPACEKLGFKNDSDLWRNCILQMSSKDDFEYYNHYPNYAPNWYQY